MSTEFKPAIVARFKTDTEGNPVFVTDGDTKHYEVTIGVENAPQETYAATFELDPTYYDPIQTVRPDTEGQFSLETTSYGDYDVTVRLRTKEGEIPLADSLKRALQRSYGTAPANPALMSALTDIEKN